jgi:cell division protein FtsB
MASSRPGKIATVPSRRREAKPTTGARARKAPARAAVTGSAARRTPGTRGTKKARKQIKWMRFALLALFLIAAALYFQPLRSFYSQQTKYAQQRAALVVASRENSALTAQVARMKTAQYVLETAREDFQLVPPGMQAFFVAGLPADSPTATAGASDVVPSSVTMSLSARLADLWRTIRQ